MTNQNGLKKVTKIDARSVRYLVTELDHPNVGTLVHNNQSKLKYLIIYLNSTTILLCFHTLFYFFRAKAGSEPIVVDNLWATKKARKRSVPSE